MSKSSDGAQRSNRAASTCALGRLRFSVLAHILDIVYQITTMLGELEQIVLLAVLRVGEEAYGVPVHEEIVRLAKRDLTLGTVYKTLSRLEDKGFVLTRPSAMRPASSADLSPNADM